MVAKCSYAFNFATELPDSPALGFSENLPEMVSLDMDHNCPSESSSGTTLSNGCPASSCSSFTKNGCLSGNNCCLSTSNGCQLANCTLCTNGICVPEASDECLTKSKEEINVKEKSNCDVTKEMSDLSMVDNIALVNPCCGSTGTLHGSIPVQSPDVKPEMNQLVKSENYSRTDEHSEIVLEKVHNFGSAANAEGDQHNDDSGDKEGSSSSLWGDPPVLDNSVLWDSHSMQKEELENEASSKIASGMPLLDGKTVVLWDKPPSLTKMEQEENDSNSDESKRILEHTGSRRWLAVNCVGAGLQNLGNTCFVNATLQCLTYTPPLVNYLLAENNSTSCRVDGLCLMCELGRHMTQCFQNSGGAIKPHSILQKLKVIAKHMRWGRQEDAHEFLRYMVDAMNKSCINGHQVSLDNSKETIVNKIFGGYLRSQVTCLQCKAESNTYDPFLDLSLDVKNVSSIVIALQKFVLPETLDIDNAYNCTQCEQKVCAQKRFTIHRLSHILTIQLKRYGVMGGKVTRHIAFPEKLDLRPYMSKLNAGALLYQLYGVLVHDGHSTNSGHYYCYIMTAKGDWYCMNDHMVRRSSLSQVLNAEAYLLLYIRQPSSSSGTPDNISLSNSSPDGNSPIHRGAIIGDSQTLDSIMKEDLLTPKERVTCRGGQLPTLCKGRQISTKIKSILTGSKLQYSKTIQRKVKRLTKSPNFTVTKCEKKTAGIPLKQPKNSVLRKNCYSEVKNDEVVNDSHSNEDVKMNIEDLPEVEKLNTSDRQKEETPTAAAEQIVDDKVKMGEQQQIVRDKLKPENKHQFTGNKIKTCEKVLSSSYNNKTRSTDKPQVFRDKLKAVDRLRASDKSSELETLLAVNDSFKSLDCHVGSVALPKFSDKGQAICEVSREPNMFLNENSNTGSGQLKKEDKSPIVKDRSDKTNQSPLCNFHKNSKKIGNAREGEKLTGKHIVALDKSLKTDNQSFNDGLKSANKDKDIVSCDESKSTYKNPLFCDQSRVINDAAISRNESCKNLAKPGNKNDIIMDTEAEGKTKLPRIVLKIKQGKVLLDGSPDNCLTESSSQKTLKGCDREPAVLETSSKTLGASADAGKYTQRPVGTENTCAKSVPQEKQYVCRGSGNLCQKASGRAGGSVVGLNCRSVTSGRRGTKGLSMERPAKGRRKNVGEQQKDMTTRSLVTQKSYDIYDFNADSDNENLVHETPMRKSPKASLLKSASFTLHDSVDSELNATTMVPGLNIPLNQKPRTFCPRSHQTEKKQRSRLAHLSPPNFSATENSKSRSAKGLSSTPSLLPKPSKRKIRSEVVHFEQEHVSVVPSTSGLYKEKSSMLSKDRIIESLTENLPELQPAWRSNADFGSMPADDESSRFCQHLTVSQSRVESPCLSSETQLQNPESHKKRPFKFAVTDCNINNNLNMTHLASAIDDKNSSLTMEPQGFVNIPLTADSGNQPLTQRTVGNNPDLIISATRLTKDRKSRKIITRQDHRTHEKRRELSVTPGNNTDCLKNKGRPSLKRTVKFSGTYDAEMFSKTKEKCELSEQEQKLSAVSPTSDSLTSIPIKLKIRKVSTGDDGANFYQVIPDAISCLRPVAVSAQECSNYNVCLSANATCARGSPRSADNSRRLRDCSPNSDFSRPPTNNQVREARNIFQNLEAAALHAREEFMRQTGLGWSKLDETSLRQTDADVKGLAFLNQQNLPFLNSFNWTDLLNQTVHDHQSGPS